MLTRLRFSNDDIRQVESLVLNHLRWKDVPNMRQSKLKRFMRMERFEEHMELHRLDCLASHGWLDRYEFVKRKQEELPQEVLKPPRLVTGHDLIRAGYEPGPAFSRILSGVEDAQLKGSIRTTEEAMSFVRSQYSPPAGEPVLE